MCLLRVTAQQTTAVCLSQYNWMDNSKGQNPCLIAAYVQGVCSGGQFTVDALDPGTHYVGPYADEANACECGTVTYSLISACSICQNRTYITWSSWAYNCTLPYTGYSESIPSGTAIPQWAYQNVSLSDDFNATLAQAVGDGPESAATKAPSTAYSVSTSTSPTASFTPSPSSSTSSNPFSSAPKSSNSAVITGGVVGGVVGLAALAAVATWFFVHRRQVTPPSPTDIGAAPVVINMETSPFTSAATQPLLYDPSDPNTFPTPSTMQAIYSSSYHNSSTHSGLIASQGQRPSGYTSAPGL